MCGDVDVDWLLFVVCIPAMVDCRIKLLLGADAGNMEGLYRLLLRIGTAAAAMQISESSRNATPSAEHMETDFAIVVGCQFIIHTNPFL